MTVHTTLKFSLPYLNESTGNEADTLLFRRFIQFSDILSKGLKMPFEILTSADGGALQINGSWTGVIGMLDRGEADLAVGSLVITEQRRNAVDFSYPFDIDTVTFATRKSEINPGILSLFRPFSLNVWVAFLLSCAAFATILWAFGRKPVSCFDSLNNILSGIFRQPVFFRGNVRNERLLMLSWLLGMLFLTNAYQSLLLSFLTFPPGSNVRNVEQLSKEVERGNYQVMTRKIFPAARILSESADKSEKVIGSSIYKNPRGFGNIENFFESSEKSKWAFIELRNRLSVLKRDFFISNDYFFFLLLAVGVQKQFCCKDRLDKIIHRMSAAGLYQKMQSVDAYKKTFAAISNGRFTEDVQKPLTLFHFSGAFIILILGLSLASGVLIIEMLVNRYRNNARDHESKEDKVFVEELDEKLNLIVKKLNQVQSHEKKNERLH